MMVLVTFSPFLVQPRLRLLHCLLFVVPDLMFVELFDVTVSLIHTSLLSSTLQGIAMLSFVNNTLVLSPITTLSITYQHCRATDKHMQNPAVCHESTSQYRMYTTPNSFAHLGHVLEPLTNFLLMLLPVVSPGVPCLSTNAACLFISSSQPTLLGLPIQTFFIQYLKIPEKSLLVISADQLYPIVPSAIGARFINYLSVIEPIMVLLIA